MKSYINPQTMTVNLSAGPVLQSTSPETPFTPPYPAPARGSYSPRQEPSK